MGGKLILWGHVTVVRFEIADQIWADITRRGFWYLADKRLLGLYAYKEK